MIPYQRNPKFACAMPLQSHRLSFLISHPYHPDSTPEPNLNSPSDGPKILLQCIFTAPPFTSRHFTTLYTSGIPPTQSHSPSDGTQNSLQCIDYPAALHIRHFTTRTHPESSNPISFLLRRHSKFTSMPRLPRRLYIPHFTTLYHPESSNPISFPLNGTKFRLDAFSSRRFSFPHFTPCTFSLSNQLNSPKWNQILPQCLFTRLSFLPSFHTLTHSISLHLNSTNLSENTIFMPSRIIPSPTSFTIPPLVAAPAIANNDILCTVAFDPISSAPQNSYMQMQSSTGATNPYNDYTPESQPNSFEQPQNSYMQMQSSTNVANPYYVYAQESQLNSFEQPYGEYRWK